MRKQKSNSASSGRRCVMRRDNSGSSSSSSRNRSSSSSHNFQRMRSREMKTSHGTMLFSRPSDWHRQHRQHRRGRIADASVGNGAAGCRSSAVPRWEAGGRTLERNVPLPPQFKHPDGTRFKRTDVKGGEGVPGKEQICRTLVHHMTVRGGDELYDPHHYKLESISHASR